MPAWSRAALLAGIAYLVIGRVFTWPASHIELWRLAAWAASGVVLVLHVLFEHFRLRNPPRPLAWHVATGVALGAFGLALAGMVNSLQGSAPFRPIWFIALVAWPLLTAIPGCLVAFVIANVLARYAGRPSQP